MDLIVGMFIMIFAIVALLNFATISITDTPQMAGSCGAGVSNGEQGIFGTLLGNMLGTAKPMPTATSAPVVTRSMTPGSDYSQYFF